MDKFALHLTFERHIPSASEGGGFAPTPDLLSRGSAPGYPLGIGRTLHVTGSRSALVMSPHFSEEVNGYGNDDYSINRICGEQEMSSSTCTVLNVIYRSRSNVPNVILFNTCNKVSRGVGSWTPAYRAST